MRKFRKKEFLRFANVLKKRATPAEIRFKELLEKENLPFEFQRVLKSKFYGLMIADFYFPSIKLVVEIDGGYHINVIEKDLKKMQGLERRGYLVAHLTNEEVLNDNGTLMNQLKKLLNRAEPEKKKLPRPMNFKRLNLPVNHPDWIGVK